MKKDEKFLEKLGDIEDPRHRQIDKDVKNFIKEYVLTGNASESVRKVYEFTSKPKISGMVQKLLKNSDVREVIALYAHRAVHRVELLAETAHSEKVKLEANQDILDRAGILPPIAAPPAAQALVIVLPPAIAEKNNITPSYER